MIEIEVLDPIECRLLKKHAKKIEPHLLYKAEYWRKGPHKMDRYEYDAHLFSKKGSKYWYFYTGLLPGVIEFLGDTPHKVNGNNWYIKPLCAPNLFGIKFRDDQIEQLGIAIKKQRGVIKAPTGVGKTILQLGIISAFYERALILTHTQDIVIQTIEELKKFGWRDKAIQQIGAGVKFTGVFTGDVVVATMQSFKKIPYEQYCDKFPIIMIDEVHRVADFDGTYGDILTHILSPIRLGFTATLPEGKGKQKVLEALVGPVLSDFTIKQAQEKGILAKPKIKLTKVPYDNSLRETTNYQDITDKDDDGNITGIRKGTITKGVIENTWRNNDIADKAIHHAKQNEVTLIFVDKIRHGEELLEIFADKGYKVPFVQGSMKGTERNNIKKSMIVRRRKIAIATTTWKEGINIPSLNAIILADTGRSPIKVLQNIGRGLRKTDDKDEVYIYDYFDGSNRHLISQFGDRITLYMEMGWL